MHVLLLYPNRPRLSFGFMPPPYGLEIVRAHLDTLDIDSDIVNPYLHADPEHSFCHALRADTELIGISVRNLDNALTLWDTRLAGGRLQTESCLGDVLDVVRWCQSHAPGLPTILGGAAFSHMPHELLDFLSVDIGMVGASEADFVRLATALLDDRSAYSRTVRHLPSAVVRGGLSAPSGRRQGVTQRVPVLRRERGYFRFRAEAPVRTFSGCPLPCSHCIEHVGSRVVERTGLDCVVAEMTAVAEHCPEVKRFFLADSEVNLVGERRVVELLRTIRTRDNLKRQRIAGYFNPRPLSLELLGVLAAAGVEPRLTIDHVVDSVLAQNGKNFQARDLYKLVEYYSTLELELSFCLLLGQPGETRATVDDVLRFVDSIPEHIRGPIYFSPGVRVYPGTPLANQLKNGDLSSRWLVGTDSPAADLLTPVVYCESWDPFELFEYVVERSSGRIQAMNPYLSGLSTKQLTELESDFTAFHIGMAELDHDESAAWKTLRRIRQAPQFLSLSQHIELLWLRGRLALQNERANEAIEDWQLLKTLLASHNAEGLGVGKLEHNLELARHIATQQ